MCVEAPSGHLEQPGTAPPLAHTLVPHTSTPAVRPLIKRPNGQFCNRVIERRIGDDENIKVKSC